MPLANAPSDRCRWEVELLFRELRSRYRLDELPSSKSQIVKVLILASVLTLVVSRMLLSLFREIADEREDEAVFPPERFGRIFESFAPTIADRLSRFLGYDPPDFFELMYTEAQKSQSRPLLLEDVSQTLELRDEFDRVITTGDHGDKLGPDDWGHGDPRDNRTRVIPFHTNWDISLPNPQTFGAGPNHDWTNVSTINQDSPWNWDIFN